MNPITRSGAGVLLGLVLGADAGGPCQAWALVAAGLAAVLLPFRQLAGPLGLAVAIAVGLGCARTVPPGPVREGVLVAVGMRVGAASGRTGDVWLSRAAGPDRRWSATTGRVRVRFPQDAPPPGVPVVLFGRAGPVRGALPGAPDPIRAARMAGVETEIVAVRAARLDGEPPALLDPERDPTGLIRAIVLGDRSGCTPETLAILRRTGTSHLLSISGFHVGVAAALVMGATTLLFRAVAVLRPQGLAAPVPLGLGVGAAWAYTALAGWVVPAERAAGMLSLAATARAYGRGTEGVPILVWVAVALALVDPGTPATASYQLTFGAMAGLVLFVPPLVRYLPPDLPWVVRWSADGLAATFGSTLGTLPFAAWWFQAVPPLSPVANLVSLPVLGVALVPIGAVACAAPDPIAWLAAGLGTGLCRLELALLGLLAVEPWTPAVGPIGALVLGALVLGSLRRPARAAVAAAILLVSPRPAPDGLRVTFLDVGQGDAALVEWPDGRRWLVDGGPPSTAVVAWLRRSGIRRLDGVVATHGDRDHCGGLVGVVDGLDVGVIWALDPSPELAEAAERQGVAITAPVGALHPSASDAVTGNDGSIVFGVGPVLLTGDVGRAAEAAVAARLPGRFPVLKLAHHGSATSTSAALVDRARPSVAVLSVGATNPYGHPSPDVLDRLAARGVAVLRTDRDGTITLEVEPGGIRIRTARGRELWLPEEPAGSPVLR